MWARLAVLCMRRSAMCFNACVTHVLCSWVKALESVAPMRTNAGVPIREAVELAISITREGEVKRYLKRAMHYYKGNAAGTTKFAALWLAAQLRHNKAEL